MLAYAESITSLSLLEHLRASAGRDAISAAEVVQLTSMVIEVAETIGPLLDHIPITFRQYTKHDLQHCVNIIRLMGKFIPAATLERLNAVELAVLIISALLHDAGMFVSDGEKEAVLASIEYQLFQAGQGERGSLLQEARREGQYLRAAMLQDALLAEYFRRLHPERVGLVVNTHLAGRLTFRQTDLKPAILRICESHGWGVLESSDARHPERSVFRLSTNRPLPGVPVNEQYLACCLRLADIMDFDRSRTPISIFQHVEFTEEKSWEEWNKHLQVDGWHVDEQDIMYSVPCTHPAHYVGVMEFLDYVDTELRDCRQLVREAPPAIATRYRLNLPPIVDRRQVEMREKSFLTGAFRFQLDYERIMQLLMDRSLYPDPSLYLRELLQNALDACRTRQAYAQAADSPYEARIVVWDRSKASGDPHIIFQDNGIGMSRRVVENYFMRVGRSYYKSAEFTVERQRLGELGVELEATSQFGIGILSCFMVADRIEVQTYSIGDRPLKINIEGPTKYFTIQLLPEPERTLFPMRPSSDRVDGPPSYSGTKIIVHLRQQISESVRDILARLAVNVDYDIHVYQGEATTAQVIKAFGWNQLSPHPHDFPSIIRASRQAVSTRQILEDLDEILIPSCIEFDRYSCSSNLRGTAWLWLLKGPDGKGRPSVGHLAFESNNLRCAALPSMLSSLSIGTSPELKRLLQRALEDNPDGNLDLLRKGYPPEKRAQKILTQFLAFWAETSPSQRSVIRQYVMRPTWDVDLKGQVRPWFSVPGLIAQLMRGALPGHFNVDYTKHLELFPTMPHCALHGIVVPAGVVAWKPMTGISQQINFLRLLGGMYLDIRGPDAPTPSANRIFIERDNAKGALIALNRAILNHVVELAVGNASTLEGAWKAWASTVIRFVGNAPFGMHAIIAEILLLEGLFGYTWKAQQQQQQQQLSGAELRSTFGRWIPLSSSNGAEGLDESDLMTRLLLRQRPRRKAPEGKIEVDLEATIPI